MDEQEFESYYQTNYKKVISFFLRNGFDQDDALDLTQDVFFRVYSKSQQFIGNTDASFVAWLKSIMESVWKNKLKSMKTQKRAAQTVPVEDDMEVPIQGNDPLDELLTEERVGPLREAIRKLTEPARTCLIMRIYHQKRYQEIATLQKLPLSTVKNLLRGARELIKAELDEP